MYRLPLILAAKTVRQRDTGELYQRYYRDAFGNGYDDGIGGN